ncbi:MAG TPA: fibro-slime domain-containing protein [Polyangiaceae bacterium]|nr:fibro-slime domain-containing protein [Polyangiaceae bacterium]
MTGAGCAASADSEGLAQVAGVGGSADSAQTAPASPVPGTESSGGGSPGAGTGSGAAAGGFRGLAVQGGTGGASNNDASGASAGASIKAETSVYAAACGDGRLLTGVVRDFDPLVHPDFEPTSKAIKSPDVRLSGMKRWTSELGIVRPMLGPDFKPVYSGSESGTQTTFGATWFQSWFRDTPGLNASAEIQIELVDPDGDGVFVFDNSGQPFFPIDHQLLGNSAAEYGSELAAHNFGFTYELHAKFSYDDENMIIGVSGNDDLWVFVSGRLVIDLGGLGSKSGKIRLRDLGLTLKREYQLDLFGAERAAPDSQFALESNVHFTSCALSVPR